MDPQKLSQLDPKLRAAYERVMGTPVATSQAPQLQSQPIAPPPQPVAAGKKNGIMPVLFVLVGIVFIVIYTLFWTKIFNVKLPF